MRKSLLIVFILILIISSATYATYNNTSDENLTSEDFKLNSDIEVDAVTSATMSQPDLENPLRDYTEMEIYNMTIDAILVMVMFIVSMIIPLVLRKIRGKHIGSK
ncbi:MAG: hypothetical protein WBA54_04770 [Acidaminobacteraceae bacterium]